MTAPTPDELDRWRQSSLAAQLRSALASRMTRVVRDIPPTVAEQMAEVQRKYGSNRASARAVGVDERTWRRWLTGRVTPRAGTRDRLRQAAIRERLVATGQPVRFVQVTFRQRMGGRERERTVRARALDYDRAADRAIARHAARGEYGHAALAWLAGIRDDTYVDLFRAWLDSAYGLEVVGMVFG